MEINDKLLPGSILIAAVLISGTLLYTHGVFGPSTPTIPKTGTIPYTVDDLKKWAGTIKGLDKKAFAECLNSGTYAQHVASDQKSGEALGMIGDKAGTPTFFINGAQVIGAQPIEVLRQAIENAAQSKNETHPDDHLQGSPDAPVAIIEYSDFQCPFCRSFFDTTLPMIRKDYIATGKAQLIYRHFPLSEIHPMSEKSAEASECAAQQGKFWEMHDAIFTLQAK